LKKMGWCPTAIRPMRSGDGLLVRLRLSCGIVSPGLARLIADWAESFGNGLIDLTSRANLQLRGVTDETLQKLQERLAEHDLLDPPGMRSVLCSPLAGIDPKALLDVRPVVREIENALRGEHRLPEKFCFLVDDGGSLRLDPRSADVAFVAQSATHFRIGGPAIAPARPLGRHDNAFGLGVPFGRLDAAKLRLLADSAQELRLTPWRAILLVGGGPVEGFLHDNDDPLRGAAACPGAPSCHQGTVSTREIAVALAPVTPLHVSGCSKGCAHPGPSPVTLVGREGLYDIVFDGKAGDSPAFRGLTQDQAIQILREKVI